MSEPRIAEELRMALLCEHDSYRPHSWTLLDSEMTDDGPRVRSCPGGMLFDSARRIWWCDWQMSIGIQLDHSKHDTCGWAFLVGASEEAAG